MPFPPAFDRAWDETFPPDTQAANLLGQDIRNFKIDIRQRLSLLSGILANRPAPDASWGGANFGIIYIATDTNQIFQWNGATWTEITSSVGGGRISTTIPVVTNAGGVDGIAATIPAAALQIGAAIHIEAEIDINANDQVSLFFGATQIVPPNAVSALSIRVFFKADIVVSGAAAQKGAFLTNRLDNNGGNLINNVAQNVVSSAEAVANAIIIKTRQVASGAGLNVSHNYISAVWK